MESPTLATGSPESVQDPHNDELLAEARILRQHKSRLETRMQILEDHNKQLESQLHRLRELLLQVLSEQGSREAHPWGGLCHNRAGVVAERDSQKWGRTRTEDGDNPPSLSSLQQSQMATVQQPLPWLPLHISLKAARQRRKSTTPLTRKLQVRIGVGLSTQPRSLGSMLQEAACTMPSCRDAGW